MGRPRNRKTDLMRVPIVFKDNIFRMAKAKNKPATEILEEINCDLSRRHYDSFSSKITLFKSRRSKK